MKTLMVSHAEFTLTSIFDVTKTLRIPIPGDNTLCKLFVLLS